MIKLYDRIKEISYTNGTGNIQLSGAVNGFSSFSSSYSNNDALFYVVTDGTNYEIGSGLYLSSTNQIKRFPFKTTNSNQLVNFTEGLKEIYVTYPATNSVFNTSGTQPIPNSSGLAIWNSSNSLSYSDKIVFDSTNGRLGINHSQPSGSIHVGGLSPNSQIIVSGIHIGNSGIYFPSGNNGVSSYSGGRQLVHFEPNQLNINSSIVFDLSGIVNQNILLKKQNANTVFAGPSGGCVPPCSPDYPMFRYLVEEDIPDLSSLYFNMASGAAISGTMTAISGILNNKIVAISGYLDDKIDAANTINTVNSTFDARLSLSNTSSTHEGSGIYLYLTAHVGNAVSLYSGANWQSVQISSKLISTFSSLDPNTIYDIFGYLNANDISFELISWAMYSPATEEEPSPQPLNSYRSTNISKFQGVWCKTGDNTRRYIGTIRTGSSAFVDNETNRFICNHYNKVKKRIRSSVTGPYVEPEAQINFNWIYTGNTIRKIPYIPQIEVINGLDSEIDLNLVLDCNIPYARSAYTMGIVRNPEIFIDNISDTSDESILHYINNDSYFYSYESVVLRNTSGYVVSDYLSGDYQDATVKTMTASINCKPIGYEKYYGIELTHLGSPVITGNTLLNSYGIMGTYEC